MEKIHFSISIEAPVEMVYETMLGLKDKTTYERWTSLFNPTSSYEGAWEKGSKIIFIGIDANGEKGGMISEILENLPNKFVSIRHYGMLEAGKEITEGPKVEAWANSFENYTFEADNGLVKLLVELDTVKDFVDYMNDKYPKALARLKEICED
jgi:hypothetical protein